MKTVLVFAYACAPYHRSESTIGAQRPAKFAKYLIRFGWRAIVICADARAKPIDDSQVRSVVDRALSRLPKDGPLIVPVPTLEHDGMLDRAWRWAARDDHHGLPWSLVRKPLTTAKFFTGDYSQNWQPVARAAAEAVANLVPIDACIGEHSPDAGLFLARWFARRYQVPWIADFRDPFLIGQRAAARWFLAPFARRMLRSAAHVIQVTPSSVEIDSRVLGRSVALIENGFDPEEFADPVEPRGDGQFLVVLTGSVWMPSDLERFLQGMALLRDRVAGGAASVRFHYVGGDHLLVRDVARRVGVEALVDSQGRVAREAALRLSRQADVLLVISQLNYPDPYWAGGAYPGKVFEYLGAKRPILAVPADNGPLQDLLARTRAGVCASTPEEIAAFLQVAWRQWRSTGAVAYSPEEHVVEQYSRIRSAEKLAALLHASVQRRQTERFAA